MNGEFISLRMLLVAVSPPQHQLWRQAASLAAVPIELSVHDCESAAKELAKGGADICVLDTAAAGADKDRVIEAARAAVPAPLVFAVTINSSLRPDGVDGVLTKPTSAEDARGLVESCVRAKLPTRVLVVDDSGTMRSIVRKILSASRFTLAIEEAAEGQAALDRLRGENFGIVILDYNMPGLNGLETLTEIKLECPKVAVVMMTTTLDTTVSDRARAMGALAFLKKPFYPADIDAVLEGYFGLRG